MALDAGQRFVTPGDLDDDTRRYVERITKARLHQRVFRTQVLLAYEGRCTICMIKHAELLDAAHIIGDGQPQGQPVVPNGLSMCKIHHAAFDHKILGIRPDLTIHVRQDVLDEVDGWMLKGCIQGVHGTKLAVVPRSRAARPDAARLEERSRACSSPSSNWSPSALLSVGSKSISTSVPSRTVSPSESRSCGSHRLVTPRHPRVRPRRNRPTAG